MIRTATLAAAVAVAVAISPVYAQQEQPAPGATINQPVPGTDASAGTMASANTKLSDKDREFIKESIKSAQGEVELAQLVQQKAQDPNAKTLAQRIVQDHQQAIQQLKQVAQQNGIAVSAETQEKLSEHKEKLSAMAPDKISKEYVQQFLKDHEKDIKKFEETARDSENPVIKQFAQQSLPVLKTHLEMAKAVEAGKDPSTAATTQNRGFSPTASYSVQPGTTGHSTAPGQTGVGTQPGSTTGKSPTTQPTEDKPDSPNM